MASVTRRFVDTHENTSITVVLSSVDLPEGVLSRHAERAYPYPQYVSLDPPPAPFPRWPGVMQAQAGGRS